MLQLQIPSAESPLSDPSSLRDELAAAKQDAENAHKWRNDCLEVCGALTIRLRELAEFLDSLLSNKDVLNAIAQDRRKMMRSSVDKSLDISKSFRRMSLSMTGGTNFTLNDSNLLNQLTSLTDVLHNSMSVVDESMMVQDKENRPSNKCEQRRTSRLDTTQESEMVRRMAQLKTQSESEDWSEPDRQVSHERIGLDGSAMLIHSYRNSPNKHNHEMTNSSSASNSEPGSDRARRNASAVRLQSRVGDLEKQLAERNEINAELAEHLSEKVQTIQELEEKIAQLDQKKPDSNEGDGNSMRESLEQKNADLLRMQQERDTFAVDLRVATMKLTSLQQELTDLKKRHNQDVDEIMQEQRTNIEIAKRNMTERHQIDVQQNYVSRSEYDVLGHTVVEQQQEIVTLERLVQDLRENEAELKAEIMESERNVRSLKKSLDDATLLSSAGILERNKLKAEIEELQTLLNALQIERNAELVTINELRSRLNSCLPLQNIAVSSSGNNLGRSASSGNVRYAMRAQLSSTHCGFRSSSSADEKALLRSENFSPDLGIESDAGCRTSGSDTERQNRSAPAKMGIGATVAGSFVEEDENCEYICPKHFAKFIPFATITYTLDFRYFPAKFVTDDHSPAVPHNCDDADRQLYELRCDNARKSEQLKQILNKLRISNGRKEQAERDIRRELLKTHVVLKNARVNIEKAANVNE